MRSAWGVGKVNTPTGAQPSFRYFGACSDTKNLLLAPEDFLCKVHEDLLGDAFGLLGDEGHELNVHAVLVLLEHLLQLKLAIQLLNARLLCFYPVFINI